MPRDFVPSNLLLTSLPPADLERIAPLLETVDLELGAVLYESGDQLKHLYFPTTLLASLLYVTIDGASTELAVCGREGVVGTSLFMGGITTNTRAIIQGAGEALRLPAYVLDLEFGHGGSMQWLLLRYTQALMAQMAQTAVCNRHHSLDQQLCRWLLISIDHLQTDSLRMTQQLIADMLGVRREGVTEAAGRLQDVGAIRYSRGVINVVDRSILEKRVCECYDVVKGEYTRLLHDVRIPRRSQGT